MSLSIMNICQDSPKSDISITQATYQPGRFTTKQVYTVKALVEKDMIYSYYTNFILMLIFQKAFYSLYRAYKNKEFK